MLGLSETDTSEDDQLNMWIDQYTDVVATMCNRVFAYEEVRRPGAAIACRSTSPRLFLTHYPVDDADIDIGGIAARQHRRSVALRDRERLGQAAHRGRMVRAGHRDL